jgi:hypothetical protein
MLLVTIAARLSAFERQAVSSETQPRPSGSIELIGAWTIREGGKEFVYRDATS